MWPGLKEQLEFALMKAAHAGPIPSGWHTLKAQLVSVGFDPNTLDDNHQDILDLFLVCLAGRQDASRYEPETMSRSRSPPVPRPPASIIPSKPSVLPSESFHRLPSSNLGTTVAHSRTPEEGWIRLKESSGEKANVSFCFGPKSKNKIGTHIIERYAEQLRPQIKDDTIVLVYCLDSHPGRTYKIEFQIEDSDDFDILLGRYWKGDKPKEVQSDNGSTSNRSRDSRGKSDLSSSQSTHAISRGTNLKALAQSTPLYSPEYLAKYSANFLKAVNSPSTSQLNPVSMPPRRGKDKQAGFDTEPEYTKPRTKKHTRVTVATSQSDSLTEDTPRAKFDSYLSGRKASPVPKTKVERESDASVSQSSVFDADDSQDDESGGSDITSPDQASDPGGVPLGSGFPPAFSAMVDDVFGKVDPEQQSNEYEYESQ